MRDIKFRAWDKKEQDLIYGVLPLSDGTFLVENSESEKYVDLYPGMDELPPDNFELMQYTGLKDKNGVEIYEGDVLEFQNEGADHTPQEVKWEDQFDLLDQEWFDGEKYTNVEVIGNKYENPELLNHE